MLGGFVFPTWFHHGVLLWSCSWCLLTSLASSSVRQRDGSQGPQQVSQSSARRQEGTLFACHRPAQLRRLHNLMHSRSHPHLRVETFMASGSPTTNSRLGPPRRSSQPWSRRFRMLPWVDPRIVENRQRRPGFGASPTVHFVNTDPFCACTHRRSSVARGCSRCV